MSTISWWFVGGTTAARPELVTLDAESIPVTVGLAATGDLALTRNLSGDVEVTTYPSGEVVDGYILSGSVDVVVTLEPGSLATNKKLAGSLSSTGSLSVSGDLRVNHKISGAENSIVISGSGKLAATKYAGDPIEVSISGITGALTTNSKISGTVDTTLALTFGQSVTHARVSLDGETYVKAWFTVWTGAGWKRGALKIWDGTEFLSPGAKSYLLAAQGEHWWSSRRGISTGIEQILLDRITTSPVNAVFGTGATEDGLDPTATPHQKGVHYVSFPGPRQVGQVDDYVKVDGYRLDASASYTVVETRFRRVDGTYQTFVGSDSDRLFVSMLSIGDLEAELLTDGGTTIGFTADPVPDMDAHDGQLVWVKAFIENPMTGGWQFAYSYDDTNNPAEVQWTDLVSSVNVNPGDTIHSTSFASTEFYVGARSPLTADYGCEPVDIYYAAVTQANGNSFEFWPDNQIDTSADRDAGQDGFTDQFGNAFVLERWTAPSGGDGSTPSLAVVTRPVIRFAQDDKLSGVTAPTAGYVFARNLPSTVTEVHALADLDVFNGGNIAEVVDITTFAAALDAPELELLEREFIEADFT